MTYGTGNFAGEIHERTVAMRTQGELASLQGTADRLARLREFMNKTASPDVGASADDWYAFLAAFKTILGNSSNDMSLVSCLMAKDYLSSRFQLVPFDVAEKPQGANGLDIDARTDAGERIIGEIKTTSPYKKSEFGAAQITALRKDFAKLQANEAEHKYMFVTDQAAFEALKRGFTRELHGVKIVCLSSGDECLASESSETKLG
jgi:hypothetical protein